MASIAFVVDELTEENGLKFLHDELLNSYSVEVRSPEQANGLNANVTITNVPELIRSLPGKVIFFLTNSRPEPVFNKVGARRLLLNEFRSAAAIFAYSSYAAKQFEEFYRISCLVQPPPIPAKPASSMQNILCYNIPADVRAEFSGEVFCDYSSPQDFSKAKLYLHRPSHPELHCIRLSLAASHGVPCISQDFGAVQEFAGTGDLLLPQDANPKKWTQYIKAALRDQDMNSRRNRDSAKRFNNLNALTHEIAKHIHATGSYAQLPKLAAMLQEQQIQQQKQAQEAHQARTVIGGKRHRVVQPVETPPSFNAAASIFISGGIGDVLTLESFMNDAQRASLEAIYYGTSKRQSIETLMKALPNYPKLKRHIIAWDDFKDFWCFFHKHECIEKMKSRGLQVDHQLDLCEDFGIVVKFQHIKHNLLRYNESSFLRYRIASVDKFKLPARFFAIAPYSSDKRNLRDFAAQDWQLVREYLQKHAIRGVIINDANDPVPEDDNLINLSGKTNILEAVEVLKKADGFIGIDSSLSVLATKLFQYPNLHIKGSNLHLLDNKHIYYAPQTDFQFLTSDFRTLIHSSPTQPVQSLGYQHHIKEITLNVVQGLGDIFWIYQKMSPYFDRINFNILMVGDCPVQRRSVDWVKLFPKTGTVSGLIVTSEHYVYVVKKKMTMTEVLERWRKGETTIEYACNQWLEEGVALDDIDPAYAVERNVEMRAEEFPLPYDKYVTLYLSSIHKYEDVTVTGVWSIDRWLDLLSLIYNKYDLKWPVVVLGAEFDRIAVESAVAQLRQRGFEATAVIQYPPQRVVHVLRSTELFIGFQSGLNIVADNYDVKQLMIYLPMIANMKGSWVKPDNILKRIFNYGYFNEPLDTIVNRLDECFMSDNKRKLFMTSGIGDFMAMECLLSDNERESVQKVYWATRQHQALKQLVPFVFPNAKNHVEVFDDFTADDKLFCFNSIEHLREKAKSDKLPIDPSLIEEVGVAKDLNAVQIGGDFLNGKRSYHGCRLLKRPLASLQKFGLPVSYYVIHPYSENIRASFRDVDTQEWNAIFSFLERRSIVGVVINKGSEPPPLHTHLIDLTNKTSLLEALEITKQAAGFIGCSSCLSVLAVKTCRADNIHIKANDQVVERWWKFYYQPHTENTFVHEDLLYLKNL